MASQNVTTSLKEGKKGAKTLVIEVDLSQDLGPSKSGKTQMIATTGGNLEIPGAPGIKMGLNVYGPVKAK